MKEGGRDKGVPEMSRGRPAQRDRRRAALSAFHSTADGHWCGELEGDTILESEYILTLHFLGRTGEPRVQKAAEYLRRKQLPGGGWPNYEGGPADVSVSVKAYFALKLAGDDRDAPHMVAGARGDPAPGRHRGDCNSFTRIYLAIFGQWDWDDCPAVPPELVLLPDWFPFTIYKMSSWSRTIVVPLAIIWATQALLRGPARAPRSRSCAPASCPSAARRTAEARRCGASSSRRSTRCSRAVEAARLTPLRASAPSRSRRSGSSSGSRRATGSARSSRRSSTRSWRSAASAMRSTIRA